MVYEKSHVYFMCLFVRLWTFCREKDTWRDTLKQKARKFEI